MRDIEGRLLRATVAQLSPFRVRLDGEASDKPCSKIVGDSAGVALNDEVVVVIIQGALYYAQRVGDSSTTGWQDITTWATNWLTYDAANFEAQYRKVNGIVFLRGRFKNTTAAWTTATDVLTLPVGFLPSTPEQLHFTLLAYTGSVYHFAPARINTGGVLALLSLPSGAPTYSTSQWFSLDHISFVAAA